MRDSGAVRRLISTRIPRAAESAGTDSRFFLPAERSRNPNPAGRFRPASGRLDRWRRPSAPVRVAGSLRDCSV